MKNTIEKLRLLIEEGKLNEAFAHLQEVIQSLTESEDLLNKTTTQKGRLAYAWNEWSSGNASKEDYVQIRNQVSSYFLYNILKDLEGVSDHITYSKEQTENKTEIETTSIQEQCIGVIQFTKENYSQEFVRGNNEIGWFYFKTTTITKDKEYKVKLPDKWAIPGLKEYNVILSLNGDLKILNHNNGVWMTGEEFEKIKDRQIVYRMNIETSKDLFLKLTQDKNILLSFERESNIEEVIAITYTRANTPYCIILINLKTNTI